MKTLRKTLITGATGFIGGRLVEVFHLTRQREVIAAIHQWSSAARLGRFPVEIVQMDLMKQDQIEKALEGVDEIIHCAKGNYQVTVEGTRNLLELAAQKKIKHIVYLSTTEVYGEATGEVDETAPLQYTGNEYNRMKIDAEKVCWEYIQKGVPITILRPSIVYGPFSNNWSVRFAQMFMRGEWGIYEKYGEGKCNLIFIDDLVRAIVLSLHKKEAIGQAFNVNGPEIITWNEYFRRFNQKLGLPELKKIKISEANLKTFMMIPVRFIGKIVKNYFLGTVKKVSEKFPVLKKLMLRIEHKLKITPVKDEFKLYTRETYFSYAKSKDFLKFVPKISIDEGLNITKDWINKNGYLNNYA